MYYLGIDIGGTITKVGLYTSDGKEIVVSEKNNDILRPHPGWVEHDLHNFWDSVCWCIQNCINKSGVKNTEIKGIGFSAHGKGLYPIDVEGKPVRKGIISSDTRATSIVKKWFKKGIDKQTYQLGRQQLWTAHPVSLLAWIKENEPENYQKIDTVLMGHDYIRFKLSGKKYAEITNISGSNAYNIVQNAYDKNMLALFGLKDAISFFPPIISSFEQAGTVTAEAAQLTGLAEGTPLYGGFFDVVGGAIIAGVTNEEILNVIAGTWAITTRIKNKIVDNEYLYIWGNYALNNMFFVHEGSPTSASNLQWFIDNFMEQNNNVFSVIETWLNNLEEDNDDNLFFFPYLYGSNISLDLHGQFYGIQAHHKKEHLLKAIYEGVVLSYLIHHERIINLEPTITKVRFTGGPSNSKYWMQLFCDAINIPIETIELQQPGCSSAAFCAIVGNQPEKSIEQLLNDFQPSYTHYTPNIDRHRIIQKRFEKYKIIGNSLADIAQKLQK
ncbi:FGGY-family carbohydrate kinase [Pasteurella skyensis]|uniref:FGGY-family carbohydrate kinase n=1 Tax=Phocoenobacter skyensis TaxID=97481 RepID=A0AAJ6N7U5_9PAST|nr:FGGY-family carbohydrate kinase [Pasteurella skyensis]MDP8161650.1 FGGY-family carbohydrate kinase [Pasteurella skyensis]MDP8171806.1 FGGY-family carbohydrate kinase [Pasteurella skyensis]MDP8178012.1 FGGY-family carbohydrate kinase [Pasteurella skyensis]MDP8182329.1 FGGY-family carbohydrate kinase [Pasteurella skyensis]MDP8188368.1 FGGY-family carbohydrate kinase [Pasteurella skyensis]